MIDNWKDKIGDLVDGLPFAYCVHDRDTLQYIPQEDEAYMRKVHVHCMLAFPNTTTCSHAFEIFNKLSKVGCRCVALFPKVCGNVRGMYNYLIHDTDSARLQKKTAYDPSERICGNNFDIGLYEQLSQEELDDLVWELSDLVVQEMLMDYNELYVYIRQNLDKSYLKAFKAQSSHFERMCRANYNRFKKQMRG